VGIAVSRIVPGGAGGGGEGEGYVDASYRDAPNIVLGFLRWWRKIMSSMYMVAADKVMAYRVRNRKGKVIPS
jgi:hypothetical protein